MQREATASRSSSHGPETRSRVISHGFSLVELEDATEPLATLDGTHSGSASARHWDDVSDALVGAFVLVVLDVLGDDVAQVPVAQGDDVAQTLLANGPHEPLRVGVEVRGPRGKANELDARCGEGALEVRGVQRVAVDDEVPYRAPLRKPEVASVRLRANCTIQAPCGLHPMPAM